MSKNIADMKLICEEVYRTDGAEGGATFSFSSRADAELFFLKINKMQQRYRYQQEDDLQPVQFKYQMPSILNVDFIDDCNCLLVYIAVYIYEAHILLENEDYPEYIEYQIDVSTLECK